MLQAPPDCDNLNTVPHPDPPAYASHQRVRIHHGSVVHVRAHSDKHRRHTDDAPSDIAAATDTGAAGYDAHIRADAPDGIRVLVAKRKLADGHIDRHSHAEAQQEAL